MKRPRIFCFVASWCCFGLLVQGSSLTRPLRAYQAAGEPVPALWTTLPLIALGFAVWQAIGLFQMRRFNRWFAIVFLGCWAIFLIWKAPVALRRPEVKLIPATVLFCVLIAFNLLSVWYLSRRSFREFAIQFVAEHDKEKHSRMMRKVAQKKILDDIRS